MKYILLIIILLSGCAHTVYYPNRGDYKGARSFYIDYLGMTKCSKCKKDCEIFKITNKKKVICHECYIKATQ
jgi:hypothetical protein